MPNIRSAKKRLRQNHKRRLRNRTYLVAARNLIKKLEKTTNKTEAQQLLPSVVAVIDKLANRNIIHHKNADNKKSRLSLLVNKLA